MKTSKFPFSNFLNIPKKLKGVKTSDLMEKGLIVLFKNPGLPYYSPIGSMIFDRLKSMIEKEHESLGAMKVEIPGCMKKSLLKYGESIEKTFSNKFVTLPKPMRGYMLTTTHEVDMLDWLKKENLSYKQFPLYLFSSKKILRPIKNPKGILKLVEPEIFMMLSLDANKEGFKNSLRKYSKMCETIFNRLGINYKKRSVELEKRRSPHSDFDLEYFYKTPEGENILKENEKALSLSMAYKYNISPGFITFQNAKNKNLTPVVGTYGMGLERLLFASFDSSRDSKGFNLPECIRPFDSSILIFGNGEKLFKKAEEIYDNLVSENKKVLLEDKMRCKRINKARLSDYLGIPKKIIVSKSGVREIKREGFNYSNINSCQILNNTTF